MVALIESRSPFWWVAVPLAVVYLLTPISGAHIDPVTNAVTGWHLGMTGSVVLPGYEVATEPDYYRNVGWYVDSQRGPVSQYPPGAAALSAPLYRIWGEGLTYTEVTGTNRPHVEPIVLGIPSYAPAKMTAALATAIAMGLMASAVPMAGGSRLSGVVTGWVAGLVTPMWPVASSALWQHGPAAMWVALGVLMAAKNRFMLSGLAFGAAVLTRPHLLLIVIGIGWFVAKDESDWTEALRLAFGSLAGLVGLLVYNWWLWGRLTITGGYGDSFSSQLMSLDLVGYAVNLVGALFDLERGLLVVSPFLAVLVLGSRTAWKEVPSWARGAAVGGLVYLLVQYKANRFTGGDGFVAYRYPLEPLTAAGVLLSLSYSRWVTQMSVARWIFWIGVAAGALLLLI